MSSCKIFHLFWKNGKTFTESSKHRSKIWYLSDSALCFVLCYVLCSIVHNAFLLKPYHKSFKSQMWTYSFYVVSQALCLEIGNRAGKVASYGNPGTLLKSLGEYPKAREYSENALTTKIEIKSSMELYQPWRCLSIVAWIQSCWRILWEGSALI